MVFAEFFHENGQPGCGDRSVFILDGRQSTHTWHDDASLWAEKHGWGAYRICRGEAFSRSSPVSKIVRVSAI